MRVATEIDLFRFSAATWNAHRIHYDRDQAIAEGLAGPVVQAHLVGAWLLDLTNDALGPGDSVARFSWRNLFPIHPRTTVVVRATPSADPDAYDLSVTDTSGVICASGRAEIKRGVSRDQAELAYGSDGGAQS
ncbi:hypothetical protein [Nocardioides sp.]|uniref:hypothetical protein n=1 Tax=Nocardioides sp. TaxID=35761 RepID=UPI003D15254A